MISVQSVKDICSLDNFDLEEKLRIVNIHIQKYQESLNSLHALKEQIASQTKGQWVRNTGSGYTGYHCLNCQTFVSVDENRVCNCDDKPKKQIDATH